jgi:cell division protein FtsL
MASAHIPRPRRTETAPALPADRSHLKVVRPGGRRRPIRLTPRAGVTMVVLLFVALFLVAVSHAVLIEGQVRLDEIDKDVAAEQAEFEDLRLELADLESPARIQAAAADMGMVPPAETTWLTPEDAVAPAGDDAAEDGEDPEGNEDSPDTSYTDVKPYLGSSAP